MSSFLQQQHLANLKADKILTSLQVPQLLRANRTVYLPVCMNEFSFYKNTSQAGQCGERMKRMDGTFSTKGRKAELSIEFY